MAVCLGSWGRLPVQLPRVYIDCSATIDVQRREPSGLLLSSSSFAWQNSALWRLSNLSMPLYVMIESPSGRQSLPGVECAADGKFLPLDKRKKHPSLWFEDGTIILASPRMLFKVYQGILSINSLVFRDMFSLPQSPTSAGVGEDILDGVCVVQIHDHDEDLVPFLSALHMASLVLTMTLSSAQFIG